MATRVVKTWKGNVRKDLRLALRVLERLRDMATTRRAGRGGEDYLTQVTNGQTLQATTTPVVLQLTTLLAQKTTLH